MVHMYLHMYMYVSIHILNPETNVSSQQMPCSRSLSGRPRSWLARLGPQTFGRQGSNKYWAGMNFTVGGWNIMTVFQPQSLEKKENKHESSQVHIPTFLEPTIIQDEPF